MSRSYPQFDFSGAVQAATSFLMKKPNEVADVRNGDFTSELGAITRRKGYTRVGDAFTQGSNSTPTGGFVAKFSTGPVRFVAVKKSDNTETLVLSQNVGTGAWTSRITGLPVNAVVFFFMYLDEVYVTGYDPATGTPFQPRNIDKTLNVSTTRNVLNMPYCYFVVEFLGALYACNCLVSSDRFPERAYKSSGPLGAVTFLRAETGSVAGYFTVDSARYLKPTMALDIYDAGTETKLYDITITSVDKSLNRIYFTPYALTFATGAVDATTNEITLSSTALFPTGTPVQITSTTTVPGGLVASTTYYAINVSGTKIKLATSAANATAGTAIDITSTGSGTHSITLVYVVSDNDEVWLDGRKGTLNMLWNADYPTPQEADFLSTLPGADSSNNITGAAKSSNRLFLFTKNSAAKYDGGAELKTFNNSVGCISQNSIRNIDDDWLIWVDSRGRVWARNESSGQQEHISRGLIRRILKYVNQTALAASSAVTNNNNYKLYLGAIDVGNGTETLRICYSFEDNIWTIERHSKKQLFQDNDDISGYQKPVFFSDDGYVYHDENGNLDHDKIIPFEVDTGRDNFGSEKLKKYEGMMIYSRGATGMEVKVTVDTGDPITVGKITGPECYIKFPASGEDQLPEGTSAKAKLTNAQKGDPEVIEGIIWDFNVREQVRNETRRPPTV